MLDVTRFLEEHPLGEEVRIESEGKDATKEFENIGHSNAAKSLLFKYQFGLLQGYKIKDANKDVPFKEFRNKEMSAFVIKDDPVGKYVAFSGVLCRSPGGGFLFWIQIHQPSNLSRLFNHIVVL